MSGKIQTLIGILLVFGAPTLWFSLLVLFVNWSDDYIGFPIAITIASVITVSLSAFVVALMNQASQNE